MGKNGKTGKIGDLLEGAAGGAFKGVRLGPGLIGNLSIVAVALFISVAITAWAFNSRPDLAVALIIALLIFAGYLVERLVRFAEKDPAAALLGGTEFYHHLKDQSAAKNPSVISDVTPGAVGPVIDHEPSR